METDPSKFALFFLSFFLSFFPLSFLTGSAAVDGGNLDVRLPRLHAARKLAPRGRKVLAVPAPAGIELGHHRRLRKERASQREKGEKRKKQIKEERGKGNGQEDG